MTLLAAAWDTMPRDATPLSVGGLWPYLTGSPLSSSTETHSCTFHLAQGNSCGLRQSPGHTSVHRRRIAPGLVLSPVHCFSISEGVQETPQAEGGAGGAGRTWCSAADWWGELGGSSPQTRAGWSLSLALQETKHPDAVCAGLRQRKVSTGNMSEHRRCRRSQIQRLKSPVSCPHRQMQCPCREPGPQRPVPAVLDNC